MIVPSVETQRIGRCRQRLDRYRNQRSLPTDLIDTMLANPVAKCLGIQLPQFWINIPRILHTHQHNPFRYINVVGLEAYALPFLFLKTPIKMFHFVVS